MRVAELVGKAPAGAKLVLLRYPAAEPLHLKCIFSFAGGGARGGTYRRFKSHRYLALVSFHLLNNSPQRTSNALSADSLHNRSWRPAVVFVALLLYLYSGFLEKKEKEKKKAAPARGHFASLIGDLTVGRLQLFERHGRFSEVTSGCCGSDCLETKKKKKKISLLPKVQLSHICWGERREKRRRNI